MFKIILPLISVIAVTISCKKKDQTIGSYSSDHSTYARVEIQGKLRDIMKKGDISAKIDLSTIKETSDLYGLGAMENLHGEILIINGEIHIAKVVPDTLKIENNYEGKAALFISSVVPEWKSFTIDEDFKDIEELEKHIETTAASNGIDVTNSFPFLLIGNMQSADWHVINWDVNDKEHSHQKHIDSGISGKLENENLEILGFFSTKHHGIISHHTRNSHMHLISRKSKIVGHVDKIDPGTMLVLKLPVIDLRD